MLKEIARHHGFVHPGGEPVIAQLARHLQMSPITVDKVYSEKGRQPQSTTTKRIEEVWRTARREAAGYDRRSDEEVKRRMIEAISLMSPLARRRIYGSIIQALKDDLEEELSPPSEDARLEAEGDRAAQSAADEVSGSGPEGKTGENGEQHPATGTDPH